MKIILKNKNKGFTIVELIVVMAIIAILILITIPTFFKYLESANHTSEIATADTIYSSTISAVLTDFTSNTHTSITTPTLSKPYIQISSNTTFAENLSDGVGGNVTFKIYAYNPLEPMLPRINSSDWEVFVKVTNGCVDATGDIYFYAPKNNHFYKNGILQ